MSSRPFSSVRKVKIPVSRRCFRPDAPLIEPLLQPALQGLKDLRPGSRAQRLPASEGIRVVVDVPGGRWKPCEPDPELEPDSRPDGKKVDRRRRRTVGRKDRGSSSGLIVGRVVRVQDVELVGTNRSGRLAPVSGCVYLDDIQSIAPVVTLRAACPSQWVPIQVRIAVCLDNDPVGEAQGTVTLSSPTMLTVPGEFQLPSLSKNARPLACTFMVFIEDKHACSHSIELRTKAPHTADVQGRIVRNARMSSLDVNSEYSRILNEAQVAS